MSRPVDESSTIMCAACDMDLATCETIWAAEGILYCSRECGIHDFKAAYFEDAEKHFDEVAEEINPQDIGLCRLADSEHCSSCSLDECTCELCTTTDITTGKEVKPCQGYETYNDMVSSMGFDPMKGAY